MNKVTARNGLFGSLAAVVVVLLIALSLSWSQSAFTSANSSTSTPTSAPTDTPAPTPPPESCTTWKTEPSNYANTRWIGEGIASIHDAKTNEEASAAASDWLEKVKTDPLLLAAAAKQVTQRDIDKATLSSDGCATSAAVDLVVELQLVLGSSVITHSDAPSDGVNSAVDGGIVVESATPGIGGDRTAIQIALPDGRVFWVMARCGNIVTQGSMGLPPGTTDNPTCPAGQVPNQNGECVTPKSSDPKAYQAPGTDSTTDSGTGTKPRVPTVTTPAETAPAPVDTSTAPVGSETNGTAPGAEPAPAVPVPVPAPEPAVNPGPSNSGENTDTPANPFP